MSDTPAAAPSRVRVSDERLAFLTAHGEARTGWSGLASVIVNLSLDLADARAEIEALRVRESVDEDAVRDRAEWLLSCINGHLPSASHIEASREQYAREIEQCRKSLQYWLVSAAAWERIAALAADRLGEGE